MKKKCLQLLLGVFILSCAQQDNNEKSYTAPEFSLYDADSVNRSLTDIKAPTVMLHFWADWCPHCRKEFPEMQNAYQKLKTQGLEIVAVNSGQSMAHVQGIRDEYGITFPMLLDSGTLIAEKYAVKGLPVSFFLDNDRNVVRTEHGWMTESKIREIFEQLN